MNPMFLAYAALALSYGASVTLVVLVIRRARRREADCRTAVEAWTAACSAAVVKNSGCGRVWHELDSLKHGLSVGAVTALELARIRLEEKTGLTAGKRPRRERDILRSIKKQRRELALRARNRQGRLTIRPATTPKPEGEQA
jgi:hypothetical protein